MLLEEGVEVEVQLNEIAGERGCVCRRIKVFAGDAARERVRGDVLADTNGLGGGDLGGCLGEGSRETRGEGVREECFAENEGIV